VIRDTADALHDHVLVCDQAPAARAARHDELVERHRRETAEVGRRTFRCTSTGHNAGGTWVVGPVLVDVVVWQRTDPAGERRYRPSYSVVIDGRHQYGGPAEHLSAEGVPSGEPGMLLGWTPVARPLTAAERALLDARVAEGRAQVARLSAELGGRTDGQVGRDRARLARLSGGLDDVERLAGLATIGRGVGR
jgi:hypothetical protein